MQYGLVLFLTFYLVSAYGETTSHRQVQGTQRYIGKVVARDLTSEVKDSIRYNKVVTRDLNSETKDSVIESQTAPAFPTPPPSIREARCKG